MKFLQVFMVISNINVMSKTAIITLIFMTENTDNKNTILMIKGLWKKINVVINKRLLISFSL